MRLTIGRLASTAAFGLAFILTFSCSFCNADGNATCNPIPSYFPENECTSTPDTSVVTHEWCRTDNKYH